MPSIVLVGQAPGNSKKLRRQLGRHGLDVVDSTDSGRRGLFILQKKQPDLAILETTLPDTSGLDVLKLFKLSSRAKTKFLVIAEEEKKALEFLSVGADSCCLKQASFSELVDALRLTHAGKNWLSPEIARSVVQSVRSSLDGGSRKVLPVIKEDALPENAVLTFRELEVLRLIVDSKSNKDISMLLDISVGTVKRHIANIMSKLYVEDRTQAAVLALRSGLVG